MLNAINNIVYCITIKTIKTNKDNKKYIYLNIFNKLKLLVRIILDTLEIFDIINKV